MNKILFAFLGAVAACVVSFNVSAQEVIGDAAAGAKKNALCVGCHGIKGYHTGFPEVYRVPEIAGQGAGYISAALHAYKVGDRKHPSMRTTASSLTDQDIADLAAYYASLAVTSPMADTAAAGSAQAMELVTRGGCTTCHGANFSKPIMPEYPKIAGQLSDYLYAALRSYKTNDRPLIGRGQPIMGGVAKQFSNADLKVLADYVASLPSELQTVQRARIK
jgi:cytochrome c553